MDLLSEFDVPDDRIWDSELYRNLCSFVPENGRELVDILDPHEGERILDLGCGTGQLTARIARQGADVVGIDASPEMIATAREDYPELTFYECDALEYQPDSPFDAVFSNAVLHWIQDQGSLLTSVNRMLKPGGRFVAEFGAQGNIRNLRRELHRALSEAGYDPEAVDPWYFPSEEAYAKRLRNAGFSVRWMTTVRYDATLNGDEGLGLWLTMFGQRIFNQLSRSERDSLVDTVTRRLREVCYENGEWNLDYRRLRFVADKNH